MDKSTYLVNMLRDIYDCKHPFTLVTVDKRPKTRMGVYIVGACRIRVYTQFNHPIEETAIHEYAHHIHETEKRKDPNRRRERMHGPEYWRIYSALMSVAIRKGIFTDHFIADIVNGTP